MVKQLANILFADWKNGNSVKIRNEFKTEETGLGLYSCLFIIQKVKEGFCSLQEEKWAHGRSAIVNSAVG